MMLDTHVLLWLIGADERLGVHARDLIERDADGTFFSAISLWEIAMLVSKKRLMLACSVPQFLSDMRSLGLGEVPVEADVAVDAGALPGSIHGDPADRIIVATTRVRNVALLTADKKILAYAAEGHVKAIDARR